MELGDGEYTFDVSGSNGGVILDSTTVTVSAIRITGSSTGGSVITSTSTATSTGGASTQITVLMAMPAALVTTVGASLSFTVATSDTVEALKTKVEAATGVATASQLLYLNGTALSQGTATLSATGVGSCSEIELQLSGSVPSATAILSLSLDASIQTSQSACGTQTPLLSTPVTLGIETHLVDS